MSAPESEPVAIHWVDGAQQHSPDTIALDDHDVLNKDTILRSLAQHFAFPAYFGGNWDAAYDLLLDQVDPITEATTWRFAIRDASKINAADWEIWLQLMTDVVDYARSRDIPLTIEVVHPPTTA